MRVGPYDLISEEEKTGIRSLSTTWGQHQKAAFCKLGLCDLKAIQKPPEAWNSPLQAERKIGKWSPYETLIFSFLPFEGSVAQRVVIIEIGLTHWQNPANRCFITLALNIFKTSLSLRSGRWRWYLGTGRKFISERISIQGRNRLQAPLFYKFSSFFPNHLNKSDEGTIVPLEYVACRLLTVVKVE